MLAAPYRPSTLITAGLVVAIWLIAGPALVNVFETAIERVLSA